MTNRTDFQRLNYVAKWMSQQFSDLAEILVDTVENYVDDLLVKLRCGRVLRIEVKTIKNGKHAYRSKYLSQVQPFNAMDGDVWFLNYDDKNGDTENSKWGKIQKEIYDGLIFYLEAEDEILLYNKKDLKEAARGTCLMCLPHTTEFGDRKYNYEKKIIIDREKYTKKYRIKDVLEFDN